VCVRDNWAVVRKLGRGYKRYVVCKVCVRVSYTLMQHVCFELCFLAIVFSIFLVVWVVVLEL
jgi:hypothetical protein